MVTFPFDTGVAPVKQVCRLIAVIPTTCLLVAAVVLPANADPFANEGEEPDLLVTAPDLEVRSRVPDDLGNFIVAVQDQGHTSIIWDDEPGTVRVVLGTDQSEQVIDAAASTYGVTDRVRVEHSAFSMEDLLDLSSTLVASGEATWAAPTPDLTGVDIGVLSADSTPPAGTYLRGGVPVNIIGVGEVVSTSRKFDQSPFIAGADIMRPTSPGRIRACSSSFAFWGTTSNHLWTADHCTSNGMTWYAGRSGSTPVGLPVIGTATTLSGANLPDIAYLSGRAYRPLMYYGTNNSNSALAIHGRNTPAIGDVVCYSGAPSGTVCNNTVTHTGLVRTYSGGEGPYYNLARTVQNSGVPASGHGDSGGPAFTLNSAGEALAAGVISGMESPRGECTGDPAVPESRQCSHIILYAPLVSYLNRNPDAALMIYGAPFRDVPRGTQFATEMQWMKWVGLIEDPTTAYIRPLDATTRASMALFMYRMKGSPTWSGYSCFSDVYTPTETNRAICWLKAQGIAGGYLDGTFRPNQAVKRDAMAAFLYRLANSPFWTPPAASPFSDVTPSTQFYKEITWLADRGVSTGWSDGTFRPLLSIARDAMSAFLYRMRSQGLA